MGAYRERLFVPVSYWLLAVPVAAVLGAEAYFFVDGFIPPLVIGLLLVLEGILFVRWSRATIEVTGPVLRADGTALALREAGDVIALDEKQAAQLRGPRADPAAHLLLRPYLRRAVYIGIADPEPGGAPYWLIFTRHPERLAAAIGHAREAIGASDTVADPAGPAGHGEAGYEPGSFEPDGQQPDGRQSVG